MFFSITRESDSRFPNNHQVGNAWVNLDPGWQCTVSADGTMFAKGYADDCSMSDIVGNFKQAGNHTGNYCVILCNTTGVIVRHNRNRSFELWHGTDIVTNLPTDQQLKNVWASHEIHIDSAGWQTLHNIDTDNTLIKKTLTVTEATDQIISLLDNSIQEFFANNSPEMKLYYSGGVDTLMLYSLLKYNQKPFTLIPYTYYEQDYFTTYNQEALHFFWNYKQIHHWTEPSWLATGSHGDEYFLRGPEIISMLTSWHDINFSEVIEANPDSYHAKYFKKNSQVWEQAWNNRHKFQDQYPSLEQLHTQILNFLLNDYQYLHLGNTLTWTPFKNIELVRILLQCPIHDLIPQFINADISKQVIARTSPELLQALSKWKNHNSTENVLKLFDFHKKSLINQ